MPYVTPGVTIATRYAQIPQSLVSALVPCVIGPQYQLFQYAEAGERAQIALGAYDPGNDAEYAYPGQPSGSSVDTGYVRLYAEDVWAKYQTISASAATPVHVVSNHQPNKIRAAPLIGEGEEGKNGADDDAVATNGVFLQAGGFYVGGAGLPSAYYLHPTGGSVGGSWSANGVVSALNDFASDDAQDARLAWRTSAGQFGTTVVSATANPLTAGTKIQGPHGLVFDFDAVDHDSDRAASPRKAGRLSYTSSTGVPVDADTVTVDGVVFEFDANSAVTGANIAVDITGLTTVAEMVQALKLAIDAAIEQGDLTDVVEALHIPGTSGAGTLLIIGNGSFGTLSTAVWNGTDPTIVSPAAHNSWLAPRVLRFTSADGDSHFSMSLRPSAVKSVADKALDAGALLTVQVDRNNVSAVSVAYAADTAAVSIEWYPAVHTLDDLRDALVASTAVSALFKFSAISGTVTDAADLVIDGTGSGLADDVAYTVMRDFYRIRLSANPYVFKTGNGTSHTSQLLTRGVKVGDRVSISYVDSEDETRTLDTTVAAIEADATIAGFSAPTVATTNTASQDGDTVAHGTGLDIIEAGADNQRVLDGVNTALYALNAEAQVYPGRLALGLVDETYRLVITTGGLPGAARCTVYAEKAGIVRSGVRISYHPNGDATEAVVYLGDNVWAVLDQGSGDADIELQAGDSYTFSRDVEAPFVAHPADDFTASGDYTGARDTTYRIEVLRGGSFEREAVVSDGVLTPNQYTLTYTGQPSNADTITIGSTVFEFRSSGSPTAGRTAVTIGGDADASYSALVDAINASAERAVATQSDDDGTVVVQGAYAVINACAESAANVTAEKATAHMTAELDWAADVDDEYVLTCTQEGALTDAVFALSSERGDNATGLQFAGSGVERTLGSQGLTVTITLSGTPTFLSGQSYVIRVYGTRPQVKITDSAGIDQQSTVVVADDTPIALGGNGVYLTIADNRNTNGGLCAKGGLLKGDVIYVAAQASGAGPNVVLSLRDQLDITGLTSGREADNLDDTSTSNDWNYNYAPTLLNVELFVVQASVQVERKRVQSAPDYNFVPTAEGCTVKEALAVQDASWVDINGDQPWLPVTRANLFLEYRALLPGDGIYEISGSTSGVSAALGRPHEDNPLALGVHTALLNSASRLVRYYAVPTDDLAGYETVLAALSRTSKVYAVAPMTSDRTIVDAVTAHVRAMSTSTKKRWRLAIVSVAAQPAADLYTAATNSGTDWLATITRYAGDQAGEYRLLSIVNGAPSLLSDVAPGDEVGYAFGTDAYGDATYAAAEVESVLTNSMLLLKVPLTAAVAAAAKIEIRHPRTGAELAAANAGVSAGFGSPLIHNVLPDLLYSGAAPRAGMFAAAAYAGLIGSVSPQQPLTNIEVQGFTDVPMTYRTWTDTDLDTMAAAGTVLIVQDERGGPVYVRHQVSTAAADGVLATTELSMIKALHAGLYYFDGLFTGLTGTLNATPRALAIVGNVARGGVAFLTSARSMGTANDPMLLSESTDGTRKSAVTSIVFHPTARDRVLLSMHWVLPAPFNGLDIDIEVG